MELSGDMNGLTLRQVCERPQAFLDNLDVGALNLMCALGLRGAENIDPARYQAWMDDAARVVDVATRQRLYRFESCPAAFHQSLGYFRSYYLLQVLQEDLNVRYNPARARDP